MNYGIIDDACDNLVVGNTYCLGWAGEDCTTTYVVQANDDCDIISSAAGISLNTLYQNNPQINEDCTNIYIGEVSKYFWGFLAVLKLVQVLCTANTVQVPAPPSGTVPATSIPATATPANPDDDLPWCDE